MKFTETCRTFLMHHMLCMFEKIGATEGFQNQSMGLIQNNYTVNAPCQCFAIKISMLAKNT